jgi:hypothetical protein
VGLLAGAAAIRRSTQNLRQSYRRQADECEERRRRRVPVRREPAHASISAGFTIEDARPAGGTWIWDPVTQRWYQIPGR